MTLTQEAREGARQALCPATVLVVDDDPQALAALQRTFRGEPYETLFTGDPFQALEWVKQRDVHLVITDEFMPGMMGTELLEAVRHRLPDAAVILLTGYPNMAVSYRGFQQRVDLLMVKPWNDLELRDQVRRLLREDGWDVPQPPGTIPSDERGVA
jgi:CheY-like chemotaxis protein